MPIRHHLSPAALRVIVRLQEAGYEAYLVGGAVRDLLLGRVPKDHDVATSATPEQVREVFRRQARIIGRRFRLAHVIHDQETIEVSTFRREPTPEERKGRQDDDGVMVWRDNVYGTLADDARRRDFTVNAIYYDPGPEQGRFVDYTGGIADLQQGLVRTIGDAETRVQEDPVRILRAAKLMGQYGFQPEAATAAALASNAERIQLCSQARLLEELYKVLKKPYTHATFTACHQLGLLQHLLPGCGPHWESPAGQLAQASLRVRDELLAADRIYPSRVTGLAALLLPFVIAAYNQTGDPRDLWENFSGINKDTRRLVTDLLHPYQIPRFALSSLCDVLLLQPKLLAGKQRNRLLAHPEYDRGREAFLVFAQAAGLPPATADRWPPQPHHRTPPRDG